MTERERIEALAEELASASFCPDCFVLVRAGEACPNGRDDTPDEARYAVPEGHANWIARLRAETEGGWG